MARTFETDIVLAAGTRLRVPLAASAAPQQGDVYIASDFLRWRDSTNTEQVALTRAGNLANIVDPSVARMNLNAQKTITYGTAAPTGGSDGDIYLQYS